MPHADLDRLRSIKTLASLIAYLRDELDWPIESDDIEDISFDYTSAELGIAAEAAVRIKEIKQLRPLNGNQPWGIFWVNFEKKRLPVVVMRLILRALVLKKRASSGQAERQAWAAHDLLFISAYGEETDRAVSFAHFVENPGNNLAELRVLGWDDDDTPLHMDYVAQMLHAKLRWDDKLAVKPDAWRKQWSDAFLIRHRFVVRTSEELATTLAALARRIRSRIRTVLRSEDGSGEMRKLQRAFQTGLIHDLDDEGFADMFAQTVTYGLFSLACRRTIPGEGTAFAKDDLSHYFTSPFLKEMLGVFLGIKSRKGTIDFDELGVSDVTDLLTSPDTHMEVVLADFNNKTRGEDPVIHFYEHFLSAYNKQLKIQRGVFYTPQPVVSYIVRSAHELLQTEFGLEDGLASTVTWGEMIERSKRAAPTSEKGSAGFQPAPAGILPGGSARAATRARAATPVHASTGSRQDAGTSDQDGRAPLKLPPLTDEPGEKRTISPDEPFVQILDPATGTATFLVEVIEVIHRHLAAKWKTNREALPSFSSFIPHPSSFETYWNAYVPAHLLTRLHAFELMMAPYAIAHMKIGLKLAETGYRFGTEERARIYLTNALEPKVKQLPQIGFDALAHEAAAVNEIKWYKRFTVVIGNPPYSGISSNNSEYATRLVDAYKIIDGEALNERKLWLQDDYVKFIRKAQMTLNCTGVGVFGFITNHGYFGNPTFRGMRQSLLGTFSRLRILDLHGNSNRKEQSPDGSPDKPVFDIKQGVGICLAVSAAGTRAVGHAELWGEADGKYAWLSKHRLSDTDFAALNPDSPYYFFIPWNIDCRAEYDAGWKINEALPVNSAGFITARDHFITDFDESALLARIADFANQKVSDAEIRTRYFAGCGSDKYPEGDTRGWKVPAARQRVQSDKKWKERLTRCLYRPFDFRTVYWADWMVDWPRPEVMGQMLHGDNLALLTARSNKTSGTDHFFCSSYISETKCAEYSGGVKVFL